MLFIRGNGDRALPVYQYPAMNVMDYSSLLGTLKTRSSVTSLAGHLHCYVNLQEKKKTLPLSGTLNHY